MCQQISVLLGAAAVSFKRCHSADHFCPLHTPVLPHALQDAKKDEACRKAYKLLAGLHETCAALVACVEATGATGRDTQGLEEQVRRPAPCDLE